MLFLTGWLKELSVSGQDEILDWHRNIYLVLFHVQYIHYVRDSLSDLPFFVKYQEKEDILNSTD
jgi:hypothetical protein